MDNRLVCYSSHRFPAGVISYAVWLYYRFCLSYRDVEELLAQRGITVSHESIRRWCHKFGQSYAKQLKRRFARAGDKWYLDEVRIVINGEVYWLWRAVDQNSRILDILVQKRRNKRAAKRFFRRLLKGNGYVPRVLVTDKLRSYSAAHREVMPSVEHRRHKGLNNRAESSHQPTRYREHQMKRFKSMASSQRFLSAFEPIRTHFCPRRHLMSASIYRETMRSRLQTWNQITLVSAAA